jgi:hypothetical protein
MLAKAGIQAVGDHNNFKDLDSCFRRNDPTLFIATQPPMGEDEGMRVILENFSGPRLLAPGSTLVKAFLRSRTSLNFKKTVSKRVHFVNNMNP